MNLRTILFSQYPALFLLAVLFLIAHLRVRKTSAVKSVLWVILFGAALAASVVCCFLGIQAELWTLKTLITLGFWSWFGVGLVLLCLVGGVYTLVQGGTAEADGDGVLDLSTWTGYSTLGSRAAE